MKVLELYSGIGGMHYAIKESGIAAEVVAAVDVNTNANSVYSFNFPNTRLLARNIQSFSVQEINKMAPDMILLSPPCQPFTRVGLKRDVLDERTCSLLHVIKLLPDIALNLSYILLENVKGFEISEARNRLVEVLESHSFTYQEFLLNPMQFGIPNTRLRYYLLAKRSPHKFCFQTQLELMDKFPTSLDNGETSHKIMSSINVRHRKMADEDQSLETEKRVKADGGMAYPPCYAIKRILEFEDDGHEAFKEFAVPKKLLGKCSAVLDVVTPKSKRSCCFTKAYGHYADGTGSVLTNWKMEDVHHLRTNNRELELGSQKQIEEIGKLRLRFFTPREISRLMCFPEEPHFSFPESITTKQRNKLLGNSVNVHVIALLISLLVAGDYL